MSKGALIAIGRRAPVEKSLIRKDIRCGGTDPAPYGLGGGTITVAVSTPVLPVAF